MPSRATRSKVSQRVEETSATEGPQESRSIAADPNPPQLFVLPRDASAKSRFVSLVSGATNKPERYLYCPQTGIYELKKIAAASHGPTRSLLLAASATEPTTKETPAYILQSASVITATKMDPLFLLMPLFELEAVEFGRGRIQGRMEEDLWERLGQTSAHMATLLRHSSFRNLLRSRLAVVADMIDMGDEQAYKLNLNKLVAALKLKVEDMAQPQVWPASLEEAHVRKLLQVPKGATRARFVRQADRDLQENMPANDEADKAEIEADTEDQNTLRPASEQVKMLARTRAAQDLILHSHVPKALHQAIRKQFDTDFQTLDDHLAAVAKLKAEVQALQTLSDNISRKRGGAEDDEAAELRAEKRRKKEEEEARKKSETRAAKQLKKVNTSGMKKMSAFFSAKAK